MMVGMPISNVISRVVAFISASLHVLSHSWFKLRWTPSSKRWLVKLDEKLRSNISHSHQARFVTVQHDDKSVNIWTVAVKGDNSDAVPLVVLHGMGGGCNMFLHNVDSFAQQRDVYMIDMPGFGLSSRLDLQMRQDKTGKFIPTNEYDVETFYTDSLEKWFSALGLQEAIVLGHSYGAYIGSVFSMRCPNHVKHLILADPWGFPIRPEKISPKSFKIRMLLYMVTKIYYKFTLFAPIRVLGPLGPFVFWSVRPDLHRRYAVTPDDTTMFEYLYACNTADLPSGEYGFLKVSLPVGYAKRPIVERVNDWSPDMGVTFIFGEKSWVDRRSGTKVKETRHKGHVDIQIIKDAGHHVHTDRPTVFNRVVELITAAVDRGENPSICEDDIQRGES